MSCATAHRSPQHTCFLNGICRIEQVRWPDTMAFQYKRLPGPCVAIGYHGLTQFNDWKSSTAFAHSSRFLSRSFNLTASRRWIKIGRIEMHLRYMVESVLLLIAVVSSRHATHVRQLPGQTAITRHRAMNTNNLRNSYMNTVCTICLVA